MNLRRNIPPVTLGFGTGDCRSQIPKFGVGVRPDVVTTLPVFVDAGTPEASGQESERPAKRRRSTLDPVLGLVREKHQKYNSLAMACCVTFYSTRGIACVGAALLPFLVGRYQEASIYVAMTVAIALAVDTVVRPFQRWELYSTASNMLAVAELKHLGQYSRCQDMLDVIVVVENKKVEGLSDLMDTLKQIKGLDLGSNTQQ